MNFDFYPMYMWNNPVWDMSLGMMLFLMTCCYLSILKFSCNFLCNLPVFAKLLKSRIFLTDSLTELNFITERLTVWKVSKYGVFFWCVFHCIQSKYGKIRTTKNTLHIVVVLKIRCSFNRFAPKVFWCFQGVEKGCIGSKWIKRSLTVLCKI